MNKKKPKKRRARKPATKPKARRGTASERRKTRLRVKLSKSKAGAKPHVRDNEIWIYDPETGETTLQPVPYDLWEGDVITCYDPGAPEEETAIESFEVENTDTGETVISYECSEDPNEEALEIDLAVLDGFTEDYNPDLGGAQSDDWPYTIEDETGSIGING